MTVLRFYVYFRKINKHSYRLYSFFIGHKRHKGTKRIITNIVFVSALSSGGDSCLGSLCSDIRSCLVITRHAMLAVVVVALLLMTCYGAALRADIMTADHRALRDDEVREPMQYIYTRGLLYYPLTGILHITVAG